MNSTRNAGCSLVLVLTLGCLGAALPAAAQDRFGPRDQKMELVLVGTGNNDADFNNGSFGLDGNLGYYLDEHSEVVLRQSVSFINTDTSGTDNVFSTRVAYDYHLGEGRSRPFIGVNFGGVYGSGTDETFAAAPEVGVKWYVQPGAFMMLMGEYQFFFKNASGARNDFDKGQYVYSLGMGFDW